MTERKTFELSNTITEREAQALSRLLLVALKDTGQSRIIADFLLAWWNAPQCGGFALNDIWGLDTSLVTDVQTVFGLIGRKQIYPDSLGLGNEFEQLVAQWRPALAPPPVWQKLGTTDGRIYNASLVTYGNAPGYRDVTLHLSITDDERVERELEIRMGKDDSISLMNHVRDVHRTAWEGGRPIDATADEKRPSWLDTWQDS